MTAAEPFLLFGAAAVFATIVLSALVTGWFWIPGQRFGSGGGYWSSRTENLGGYLIYVLIVGAASLGALAMAVVRLRRFEAQRPASRR